MGQRRRRERVAVPNVPVDPPDPLDPAGDDDEDGELEGGGTFPDMGDLAALADSAFADWTWHIYRLRSFEDMARLKSREQRVWVLSPKGPIDVAALRDAVGGGTFEVWGYLAGKLQTKMKFELEGPPKLYTPPAPPTPTAPVAVDPSTRVTNGTDPVLLAMLQKQDKMLELLAANLAKSAAPAATPAVQGFSFREMLQLATMLRGNGGQGGVDLKDMVALFQQGIEAGGAAANGNDKTTLEMILEKGLPMIERIAANALRRGPARPTPRPGPGPAPGPSAAPAREPSMATVLETPAEDPAHNRPAPQPSHEETVRWAAAVDALARAIEAGTPPEDFADTLDDLLLAAEIDLMLAGGAPAVMAQIRTASDRYPVFAAPEPGAEDRAELYITAVLEALVEPPATE